MPDDTRDKLLDAAQDLVQRVGANAMSYQHLAEVVGIRKASIHYHFPTKADLLETMVERYHKRFMEHVSEVRSGGGTGGERLAAYLELFTTTLRDSDGGKLCACGMLGAEVATLGTEMAAVLNRFYEANHRVIETLLREGAADGSVSVPGEAAVTARVVFGALEGGMLVARTADDPAGRFAQVAQELLTLLTLAPSHV